MESLVVMNLQYDYIIGNMKYQNVEQAVKYTISFLNTIRVEACYILDWHSPDNKSFYENGGVWPIHCLAGEMGAHIHAWFYTKVKNTHNRPSDTNSFLLGVNDEEEENSAYDAKNRLGKKLSDAVGDTVYISGIANEHVLRQTVKDFLSNGRTVRLLKIALAYTDLESHGMLLKELESWGVQII